MSAQSLFSKKNIKAHQPDTHRGIMEELNLPPEMIAFIRKNARNLQIALICIIVLVLGWIFYDYYSEAQEKKSASLLASAMQVQATEERVWMLENVINDYSGTEAARWSRIELAHLEYREGRLDAAVLKYKEIIDDLSKDSPLLPLVRMALAQSYEEAGQYDQAIAQYTLLKKSAGFKQEAYLALGRIYKTENDPAQARKEYEELLSSMEEGGDPQLKSRVQAMLLALNNGSTPAASQPEENK